LVTNSETYVKCIHGEANAPNIFSTIATYPRQVSTNSLLTGMRRFQHLASLENHAYEINPS